MRMLIVEDDFTSRRVLQKLLSSYGDCEVAIDGREAVDAFRASCEEDQPYDCIFLDIMMPKMDGQQVLQAIRKLENAMGKGEDTGVKVIMTTALSDRRNVVEASENRCSAYLVKPIDKAQLDGSLRTLELI